MRNSHAYLMASLVLVAVAASLRSLAANAAPADDARQILSSTGIQGGLIVHLGCGDGKLTAALGAGERFLVHGLEADSQNVEAARRHLRALGLYGKVSVEQWTENRLPYAENIVNLFVAENRGSIPTDEVLRVLAPLGVAYVKSDGRWTQTVKPWPKQMDEWSHYLHDAGNNAVAHDKLVDTPRRLQWTCEPLWSRSHEFMSSLSAMVSARGRIAYIMDEGLIGVTTKSVPEKWTLVVRDAFNGILLWKRPMTKWGSAARWNINALRSTPPSAPRLLLAQGDRLFVTLAYGGPVSVLDAATGTTLAVYQATEEAQELRLLRGILIVRKGTPGNAKSGKKAAAAETPTQQIVAIDTATGNTLWETTGKAAPFSLAAEGEHLFYVDGKSVLCLGLSDGKRQWQTATDSQPTFVLAHEGRLIVAGTRTLQALSAATGKVLWTASARAERDELFVANEQLWHWEDKHIVGRSLLDGRQTTVLATDDVFTRGHHLRCYPAKCTDNFLITQNRGAEFLSLCGAANSQNDWVRGPCVYGVMPCNGLLYAGPNPCFCYAGVKLTGFNALAPERPAAEAPAVISNAERLQRGPAYASLADSPSLIPNPSDWPTYRHDTRRSGAAGCEVPAKVSPRWSVQLHGRLTPPVVSGDQLYVAAIDEHTLFALDKEDGRSRWQFTAAGRIDSPPTAVGELVLFGCADGQVYCLRASDGQLAWRFQAAPCQRRIIAFGQLESPWRVHGSILLKDDVAYCTAGRSSYLDGGIWVFALEPKTGQLLHETHLDTWARTREDAQNKPFVPSYHMEGTRSDILVSEDDFIYLGQYKFDPTLRQQAVPYLLPSPNDKKMAMDLSGQSFADQPSVKATAEEYDSHQRKWMETNQAELMKEYKEKYGAHTMGERHIGPHVFSTAGLLDDSWFNRTYWMYSATWPGFYLANWAAKTGQLLVVGPEHTYAIQSFPERNLQSPLFTPGERGYLLFADRNDNEPVLDYRTQGTTKGWGFTRQQPPQWHQWTPVRIRGMVLAGRQLFVAGPPDVIDLHDPMASFEGRQGGALWTVSAADGQKLAEVKLAAAPVFDGLVAATGRLYLSTTDGKVLCLGAAD
jgi:outer membrane protein assembly factor BamB